MGRKYDGLRVESLESRSNPSGTSVATMQTAGAGQHAPTTTGTTTQTLTPAPVAVPAPITGAVQPTASPASGGPSPSADGTGNPLIAPTPAGTGSSAAMPAPVDPGTPASGTKPPIVVGPTGVLSPVPRAAAAPAHVPHALTGRGTGSFQLARINPDAGATVKIQGTAQLPGLGGSVAVAGDLHTPGNIVNVATTGTLVLSNKGGSVTVVLTSFKPVVGIGVPVWYRYQVKDGTGTLAGIKDSGSLRLDWQPVPVALTPPMSNAVMTSSNTSVPMLPTIVPNAGNSAPAGVASPSAVGDAIAPQPPTTPAPTPLEPTQPPSKPAATSTGGAASPGQSTGIPAPTVAPVTMPTPLGQRGTFRITI